jgi:hypothetical protein
MKVIRKNLRSSKMSDTDYKSAFTSRYIIITTLLLLYRPYGVSELMNDE